jgi:hypothetical protein
LTTIAKFVATIAKFVRVLPHRDSPLHSQNPGLYESKRRFTWPYLKSDRYRGSIQVQN